MPSGSSRVQTPARPTLREGWQLAWDLNPVRAHSLWAGLCPEKLVNFYVASAVGKMFLFLVFLYFMFPVSGGQLEGSALVHRILPQKAIYFCLFLFPLISPSL